MADLVESKIIRWISKSDFIEYDHVRTPPIIMQDRDFVSRVSMSVNPQTKEFTFQYQSVIENTLPEKGYIRGNILNTTFILKPLDGNTKTQITGEIHCDPKGSVPQWVVNWFQKSWPIHTLKKLRIQAAKNDIKTDPRISCLYEISYAH